MTIFKFIFYGVLYFLFGMYYGMLTKDTVFDNFFVMLVSVFIIIFLFEYLMSFVKKKKATEPDSEHRNETFDELMAELKNEFEKTWTVGFKDHQIKIVNAYNQEELYINEKLVAKKTRKHWHSWIRPYQTLSGVIEEDNQRFQVKVKMGGLISLYCKVYVDKQLILNEKVKYSFSSNGLKEKD